MMKALFLGMLLFLTFLMGYNKGTTDGYQQALKFAYECQPKACELGDK